ncbi:fibronectin type III domain-containing protein, partial [Bacillus sp. TH13]|uniref:fibronectin type III domain-containing protein n=1 Tax=Bacillus sp. TH13 TaxID=2796379 RepID=UPI001A92D5CD
AVFSLIMVMCLSVLPSFASAERFDIIAGKFNANTNLSGNATTINLRGAYDVDGFYIRGKNRYASAGNLTVTMYNAKNEVLYKSTEYKFPYIGSSDYGDVHREERKIKGVSFIELKGVVNLFEFKVYGSEYVPQITNLKNTPSVNSVFFNWENPSDVSFNGVKIYKDNEVVATVDKDSTSYTVGDLKDNNTYKFKVVSLYKDTEILVDESNISTLIDPKKIPPNPVSFLKSEPTDKTVKLKWKKPSDDDLAGYKILKNGKKIAEIGLEEEFIVKGLEPLTEYNFGVVAVDKDKNDSTPVNVSVKTLEEKDDIPPQVPSNVVAKPSNGALIASWDKVPDKDLAGYNVYVDGEKINSDLISSTNFTVKKLENKRKYKIQVQAVDRSGNASELSLAAFGIPDTNTIPIIESTYSLQDVSDGTGVMFSQLWFALAFAVGISLAFYIIYKLKHDVMP